MGVGASRTSRERLSAWVHPWWGRVLRVGVLSLLFLAAWFLHERRFRILDLLECIALSVFALCLAACVLLVRARAVDDSVPRWQALVWFGVSLLWSAVFSIASLQPGAFENGWSVPLLLLALPVAIAWLVLLASLGLGSWPESGAPDPRGPRKSALLWLDATTLSCAVLALVVPRARYTGGFWPTVVSVAFLAGLHVAVRLLLRKLPGTFGVTDPGSFGVRLSVVALRSLTLLVVLTWIRDPRGEPNAIQGVLIVVGAVHLALETLIRRLRPSRTPWLAACSLTVALTVMALVHFRVPRRVAFSLFRSRFEACVAGTQEGELRIGPWTPRVSRAPGGAVYFHLWQGKPRRWFTITGVAGFAFFPDGAYSRIRGDEEDWDWRREVKHLTGNWFEVYEYQVW